jgi:hypothetical protein
VQVKSGMAERLNKELSDMRREMRVSYRIIKFSFSGSFRSVYCLHTQTEGPAQDKEIASAERYSDVLEKLRRAEQDRLDTEFNSRVKIQEKISEVAALHCHVPGKPCPQHCTPEAFSIYILTAACHSACSVRLRPK